MTCSSVAILITITMGGSQRGSLCMQDLRWTFFKHLGSCNLAATCDVMMDKSRVAEVAKQINEKVRLLRDGPLMIWGGASGREFALSFFFPRQLAVEFFFSWPTGC